MNESRIDMVWRHMAQMFGADALQRKFGDTPPDDWKQFINRLSDYELKRGLRRMVNGGKSFPPSLPEFLKMAHEVGGDYPSDERYNPKQIAAPVRDSGLDKWHGMAGLKLMGYISRCAGKGEYFDEQTTRPLVDAKNLWVEEMYEHHCKGTMPPDNGKQLWADCFAKAKLSIAYIRKSRGETFEV